MIPSSVLLGWEFPAGLAAGALLLRQWSRARSISNAVLVPTLLLLFRKAALFIPVVGTVSTEDQVLFWSLGAWIFFGLLALGAAIICGVFVAMASAPARDRSSFSFDDDELPGAVSGVAIFLLLLSVVLLPIDGWMHLAILPLTPLALLKVIFITPALPWLAFGMLAVVPLLLIGFRHAVPGFQMGMCVLACLAGLLQMAMQTGHWHEMQQRLVITETWAESDHKETNDFYGDWLLQLPRSSHCGITSIENPSRTGTPDTRSNECNVREQIAGIYPLEPARKLTFVTDKVAAFGIAFLFLLAGTERLRPRAAHSRFSEWGRANVAVGRDRWSERPVVGFSYKPWQPAWILGAIAVSIPPAVLAITMHNLWMSVATWGTVAVLAGLSLFVLSGSVARKPVAGVAGALIVVFTIAFFWPTISFAAAFGLASIYSWVALIAFLFVRSAGQRSRMIRYVLSGRDYRGGRGRQITSALDAIDNFKQIFQDLPDHTQPLAPPGQFHPDPAETSHWRILTLLDYACSHNNAKIRERALQTLPRSLWPLAMKHLLKSSYDEPRAYATLLDNISRSQLLRLCGDTEPSVRACAAARLGKSLHPREVLRFSRSKHLDIRIYAVESGLSRKHLIKRILRDKERRVREAALAVITQNIQPAEALGLTTSRHVEVRSFAIQSGKLNLSDLGRLRASDEEESVRALAWARSRVHVTMDEALNLTTSQYPDVRIEAINSRRLSRTAVLHLAWHDTDARVRDAARNQIGDVTQQEAELQADSRYPDVRLWVFRAGALSTEMLNERINIELDRTIRMEIQNSLLSNLDEKTVDFILASGHYERRPVIVEHAPLSRAQLIELAMSDPQFDVRKRALERLQAQLKEEEVFNLFSSPHRDVRNFAILSGWLSTERDLLLKACTTDPDETVRHSAWTLIQGNLDGKEATILADSRFAEVRLNSVRSGLISPEILNKLSQDTDSTVRQAVARQASLSNLNAISGIS